MGPGYVSCTFETGPKVHKSSPFMQPLLNYWLDTPRHSYQERCPEQTCAGADVGTWKTESRLQSRAGGYVLESDGNQALDHHMEAIIDGLSEESWLLETPLASHASTQIYQVQVFICNRRHMDPLLLPHIFHCMSRRHMALYTIPYHGYNTMGVCCVNCCYSTLFRE